MSLYAQYIQEREGFEIVETEYGFATYQISNEVCYIRDLFVSKVSRGRHVASDMADKICSIAKDNNCSELLGSVHPDAKGATDSLKVLLAYGFSLKGIQNGLLIFTKGIK